MKNALWLVIGIGTGFLAAHQLNRTAGGRAVFAELDARMREFTAAVASGYHSRDAELRGAPNDVS